MIKRRKLSGCWRAESPSFIGIPQQQLKEYHNAQLSKRCVRCGRATEQLAGSGSFCPRDSASAATASGMDVASDSTTITTAGGGISECWLVTHPILHAVQFCMDCFNNCFGGDISVEDLLYGTRCHFCGVNCGHFLNLTKCSESPQCQRRFCLRCATYFVLRSPELEAPIVPSLLRHTNVFNNQTQEKSDKSHQETTCPSTTLSRFVLHHPHKGDDNCQLSFLQQAVISCPMFIGHTPEWTAAKVEELSGNVLKSSVGKWLRLSTNVSTYIAVRVERVVIFPLYEEDNDIGDDMHDDDAVSPQYRDASEINDYSTVAESSPHPSSLHEYSRMERPWFNAGHNNYYGSIDSSSSDSTLLKNGCCNSDSDADSVCSLTEQHCVNDREQTTAIVNDIHSADDKYSGSRWSGISSSIKREKEISWIFATHCVHNDALVNSTLEDSGVTRVLYQRLSGGIIQPVSVTGTRSSSLPSTVTCTNTGADVDVAAAITEGVFVRCDAIDYNSDESGVADIHFCSCDVHEQCCCTYACQSNQQDFVFAVENNATGTHSSRVLCTHKNDAPCVIRAQFQHDPYKPVTLPFANCIFHTAEQLVPLKVGFNFQRVSNPTVSTVRKSLQLHHPYIPELFPTSRTLSTTADSNSLHGGGLQSARKKKYVWIELFAGLGSSSLAGAKAGFTVLALELDPTVTRLHKVFTGGETVVKRKDVRRFVKSDWRAYLPGDGLELGVVFGGPPCQGFSIANPKPRSRTAELQRQGIGMWLRFVELNKPPIASFENVMGLVQKYQHREQFTAVTARLMAMGYQVQWRSLNAADYGVPQSRVRIFLVASLPYLNFQFDWACLDCYTQDPRCDALIRAFSRDRNKTSWFVNGNNAKRKKLRCIVRRPMKGISLKDACSMFGFPPDAIARLDLDSEPERLKFEAVGNCIAYPLMEALSNEFWRILSANTVVEVVEVVD